MTLILVVEDNPDSGVLAEKILKHYGYDVKLVTNGQNALSAMAECKPDIILMDISLPDMDGAEVAKKLETEAPIIALTAHTADSIKDKLHQGGFKDFLEKPFHPNELVGMIKRHIPRK